jgi:hypothetical protein
MPLPVPTHIHIGDQKVTIMSNKVDDFKNDVLFAAQAGGQWVKVNDHNNGQPRDREFFVTAYTPVAIM